MATCQSETVNSVPQAPEPPKPEPEHSLPFAKPTPGDSVWTLWGKRTSTDWRLADADGELRAIAVLNLEVEGETPSAKAAELGRIFRRIARDQFERRRSWIEVEAIAAFWSLIGELAAAYTTPAQLGFAAKVVCQRATRRMIQHTEADAQAARLPAAAAKRRKAAKGRRAVRP